MLQSKCGLPQQADELALNLAALRKNDFERHLPPSFDPVPVANRKVTRG
jgi:hypothetical protein